MTPTPSDRSDEPDGKSHSRAVFRSDALQGRRILITGASRGLGAAIAQACHEAGARVALTDLDHDGVAAVAGRFDDALAFAHDVSDPASWEVAVEAVRSRWGGLDGLVNNAGIFESITLSDAPVEAFRRSLDVNLTGTFLGIQAFLALNQSRGGSIVNLASVRGIVSGTGMAAYSASKAGVRGLTRAAAVELGPLGIRVNAICPGTIVTSMSQNAAAGSDWEGYLSRIPLGDAGRPHDVAEVACWLLSDASAYVSGIDLPVDGGILATGNSLEPEVTSQG